MTSKQLRERLDYHINQIIMMSGGKELPQSQKEFVNKVLLDSVREEYKGMIEEEVKRLWEAHEDEDDKSVRAYNSGLDLAIARLKQLLAKL